MQQNLWLNTGNRGECLGQSRSVFDQLQRGALVAPSSGNVRSRVQNGYADLLAAASLLWPGPCHTPACRGCISWCLTGEMKRWLRGSHHGLISLALAVLLLAIDQAASFIDQHPDIPSQPAVPRRGSDEAGLKPSMIKAAPKREWVEVSARLTKSLSALSLTVPLKVPFKRPSRKTASHTGPAFEWGQFFVRDYEYGPVFEEPEQVGAVYYTDAHPFAGTEALPAGHPAKSPRRILKVNSAAESQYQALRIVSVPISQDALTSEQTTFINDMLMPAAVAFFADTLKVFPVSGPLGRDHFCNSMYTHTDPYKCAMDASANAVTCGDFILPASHLTGKDQFGGSSWCTGATSADYNGCTSYPNPGGGGGGGGGGVPNADFVLYVGARSVSPCPSNQGSGTLAFASSCQTDQYDRPTVGYVNFW